jgi:transmembrane sensor
MKSEINFELALKYLNGSASDTERAEFTGWLDTSEENRFQFEDLHKYWELSGKAFENYEPDMETAWKIIQKQTIHPNEFPIKYLYRIAVSIVVILSIGLGIKIYQRSEFNYRSGLITYVSNDKIKEVKLEDGSVIWLNTHSRFEAPAHFNFKERKVYLNGEAYFEIAKDINKPFIIESKNTITEVLGTSFNIRAKENETNITVTVSAGKVAFYSSKNKLSKVYLTPGMRGVWKEKSEKVISYTDSDINYLAWKTGVLQFKDTPLTEVCDIISKSYNVKIKVDPLGAKNYLFTGNFNNVKMDQMLDIIGTTLDIKFVKSPGQIKVEFK